MIKKTIAILSLILIAGQASAVTHRFGGALGYGDTNAHQGGELELTYTADFDKFSINFSPLSAIMYKDDDKNYRKETFRNGNEVCRDIRNGQFSEKSNCNKVGIDYAAIIGADYKLAKNFTVGAGVRIGEKIKPYGNISILNDLNSFGLRARAGQKYMSIDLVGTF
jgi:hypothetical protein